MRWEIIAFFISLVGDFPYFTDDPNDIPNDAARKNNDVVLDRVNGESVRTLFQDSPGDLRNDISMIARTRLGDRERFILINSVVRGLLRDLVAEYIRPLDADRLRRSRD